jgi:hypothetical protein
VDGVTPSDSVPFVRGSMRDQPRLISPFVGKLDLASTAEKSGSVHVSVSGRGFTGTYFTNANTLTVAFQGRKASTKLGLLAPEFLAREVLRHLIEKQPAQSAKG